MAAIPMEHFSPLGGVPVGTILPYVCPLAQIKDPIAPGWQLCDGALIADGPLKGQPTPILTDMRTLVGVASDSAANAPAGNDTYNLSHAHDGSIAAGGDHTHSTGASIGDVFNFGDPKDHYPAVSQMAHTHNTTSGGHHSHGVGGTALDAATNIVPKSLTVLFILRIK